MATPVPTSAVARALTPPLGAGAAAGPSGGVAGPSSAAAQPRAASMEVLAAARARLPHLDAFARAALHEHATALVAPSKDSMPPCVTGAGELPCVYGVDECVLAPDTTASPPHLPKRPASDDARAFP